MKSKVNIFLFGLIIILSATLTIKLSTDSYKKPTSKVAMNFIKCTPQKYLLEYADSSKQISPLFKNLGSLHFPVTTKIQRAQAFFDQGLKLSYAFNHAEGHRSFMETARLDPSMAMAYWGQAFALGPNINDPQPTNDRLQKINEAIKKAKQFASKSSKKEQALINALAKRYSEDLTKDISELNMAYMQAMKIVASKFPKDANVQILYAASVMNTVPWNYWDKNGNPSPNIENAKNALETAIKLKPENPGAHHYYIHMVELPYPDLGEESADKLASLMPGAGHIVHMPSHIYIRIGRYLDAVKVNQKAILADEDYIAQCFSQGLYPLAYYPHNIHFLWSSASLLGSSETAINAAKKTAEKVPIGELLNLPFLQDFASTPLLAYTRFGKWNEILTIPAPKSELKHLNLMRHYARGIAFISKGNIKEAQEEIIALETLKNDPELTTLIATPNNPSISTANIAYEVVKGELEALKGNLKKAIIHLEKAVVYEDLLVYTEPAAWHIPTRQNLGAVLLKAKQYKNAEKIYKEDLEVLRQNGWSLIGLHKSLKAQGKHKEAKIIMEEFNAAWAHADIDIDGSVL